MSWIEDNLLPKESVVSKARIHWIVFARPVLLLTAGGFVGFAARNMSLSQSPDERDIALTLGLIALGFGIAGILSAIGAALRNAFEECAVTNKRFMMKWGMFGTKTLETQLKHVQGFSLQQNIIGKILGYGHVSVTTGGVEQAFGPIHNPKRFRKSVQGEIAREQES